MERPPSVGRHTTSGSGGTPIPARAKNARAAATPSSITSRTLRHCAWSRWAEVSSAARLTRTRRVGPSSHT